MVLAWIMTALHGDNPAAGGVPACAGNALEQQKCRFHGALATGQAAMPRTTTNNWDYLSRLLQAYNAANQLTNISTYNGVTQAMSGVTLK